MFEAQWPACASPDRRFADALTGADARLGADMTRYFFTARDFHSIFLAGLPAHFTNPHRRKGFSLSAPLPAVVVPSTDRRWFPHPSSPQTRFYLRNPDPGGILGARTYRFRRRR
jgi:hypothetical protein